MTDYVTEASSKQDFINRAKGRRVRLTERAAAGPFREPSGVVVVKPFLERRYVAEARTPSGNEQLVYLERIVANANGEVDVSQSLAKFLKDQGFEIAPVGHVTGSV